MYELNDTIAAVSSPCSEKGVIVRITGPQTFKVIQQIFEPIITTDFFGIKLGKISLGSKLVIDAKLYLFGSSHSYTAENLAEIHLYTNSSVTEALLKLLLKKGLRIAGPGEFTARAYLNGKIDLAQAEAVNKIVTSNNRLQLEAAEKLLSGRLSETIKKVLLQLLDCLSLVEAGLDFSDQDTEFFNRTSEIDKLEKTKNELEFLLSGSISYESVIELASVGIAGSPNAGKSSLLNKLLGQTRSIVSQQRKTTRDVLTGLLKLPHCECVLFDCAGLTEKTTEPINELAQQAAIGALNSAAIVIFCVDISKTDLTEDIQINKLISPKDMIAIATKSDLVADEVKTERLTKLNKIFGLNFTSTSSKNNRGLDRLCKSIDKKLIEISSGPSDAKSALAETRQDIIALTARHEQTVTEAIENIQESSEHLKAGNDEVAAMMLRAAYQALSNIEAEHIDEKVLDNIFSSFCIGK